MARRFATLSALHARCAEVASEAAAAAAQANRTNPACAQGEDVDGGADADAQASRGACCPSDASPKSVAAAPVGRHGDAARSALSASVSASVSCVAAAGRPGLGWGDAAMCFDVHG